MKKIITITTLILTFAFIFSLGSSQFVSAQPSDYSKIVVTGYGEVTITPDTALISLGVKTTSDTLEQANSENKEKISKIYSTLTENNISEEQIQTKGFFANEEYSYEEKEPKLIGYTVSNQIFVKTTDLENLTNLTTLLMEDGANDFNGINFYSSTENESYKTALANALENAKEKALILSNNNATTLVEIVEESVSSFRSLTHTKIEMMADKTIFGGELTVKARITAIFSTGLTDQEDITEKTIATKNEQTDKIKTNKNIQTDKIQTDDTQIDDAQIDKQIDNTKIDVSEPTTFLPLNHKDDINEIGQNEDKPAPLPNRPERKRPHKPFNPEIV